MTNTSAPAGRGSSRRGLLAAAAAVALTGAALVPTGAQAQAAPAAPAVGAQQCGTPLTVGYYRMWRDVATTKEEDRKLNTQVMTDIPAEVDIVSAFATKPAEDPNFWATMTRDYLPKLHAQGTQVVFTLFIDDFIGEGVPANQAGYAAKAREIYDTYLGTSGLDGLDVDMERTLNDAELAQATGIITELGKLIGPKSGTDKLFIYDTNRGGDEPIFEQTAANYDYVWQQSYGRGAGSLQATWETFAPHISSCQFLPGFSFYEEDGEYWGDVVPDFENSNAAAFASWQPTTGQKGGFFGYAIDRDGKAQGDDTVTRTDFSWLKRLDALALEAAK